MPQTILVFSQADDAAWVKVLDDGTIVGTVAGTPLEASSGLSCFGTLANGNVIYTGATWPHYLSAALAELASGETASPVIVDQWVIGTGQTHFFDIGGNTHGVTKVLASTMAIVQQWAEATFTGFGTFPTGLAHHVGFGSACLSLDETILYFTANSVAAHLEHFGAVHRYDLTNSVLLSDLVDEHTTGAFDPELTAGLLTLPGGDVLVGWSASAGHGIRRYSPAGAIVRTYTQNVRSGGNTNWYLCLGLNNSFWVHTNFPDTLIEVDYDTGATLTTISVDDLVTLDPAVDWWVAFTAVPAPAVVGTITVTKVTVPEGQVQVFAFTAGGGLSPTSFNLSDGDSEVFADVAAGDGYSIAETPVPGWTTTYDVSNDSPIDNISVAADEPVVVTVTNTLVGVPYQIIRLRRAPHLHNERKRIFYSRFELDMEVGLGTTGFPATAPNMRLRWSDDAGHTWSSYYQMSAGIAGAYGTRMFHNRLGSARDRIYEVSTCDDAQWNLLAAYIDLELGNH